MHRTSIDDVKAQILAGITTFNTPRAPLGLGRTKHGNENVLAVRIHGKSSFWRNKIEWLRKITAGELDVRIVGDITAMPLEKPFHRNRVRPLKIGSSISHGRVTAGTLGCFVMDSRGRTLILSNNHVMANSNNAEVGDAICQPGTYDGGSIKDDSIATLYKFVEIKEKGNLVDAAVAFVNSDERCDLSTLTGLGKNSGKFQGEIEPGDLVCKFGRTTSTTLGRVTAVEMDNVGVGGYSDTIPVAYFNQQIEIEGAEDTSFSDGGDSGSVIFSAPDGRSGDHKALGLLFAGGPHGGSNGKGLTYANVLDNVLKAFDVTVLH